MEGGGMGGEVGVEGTYVAFEDETTEQRYY